jgi:hypothetical protein
MNEPGSSPKKHDREDEKKRQEQSQRRFRFGISYLITSPIILWLFQLFVLNPLARHAEIPYSKFKKKLAAAHIVKATIGERGIVAPNCSVMPRGERYDETNDLFMSDVIRTNVLQVWLWRSNWSMSHC